ncbi:MAG TPA: DJ-1/PfpI family protein, partial [Chthoniobacterales bacterium]
MTYYSKISAAEVEPKVIGIIGVDGVSSFDVTSALEPFATARTSGPISSGQRCYETMIIGIDRKSFVCDSGAVINAHHTTRTAPLLDTIIIPGGRILRAPETRDRIAAWLRDRAQTTRRLAAIGAGIYPLASTGLLKSRHVTTHWRFAPDVARTFPELAVSNGVSFTKSEQFYTCGGGISAMEMSLALIEEDHGPKTAFAVARELSIDVRPPGAEQAVELPDYQPGVAERLAELPAWMTTRLRENLTVEALAERACLSPRQFYRLFKQTYGCTPAA